MTTEYNDVANWQQQATQCLMRRDYTQAANLYEQAIAAQPHVKSYYWHLGLILLLQGQEVEAQSTWLLAMAEGESEQIESWSAELVEVLQAEAQQRETLADYQVAWAIRQHIREISPDNINNLLQIIQLSIELNRFNADELSTLALIPLLQQEPRAKVDPDLLLQVLQKIFNYTPLEPLLLEFTKVCLPYVHQPKDFINLVMPSALKIAYAMKRPAVAAEYAELCLRVDANQIEVLRHLAAFYQNAGKYEQGIETARRCYSLAEGLPNKIYANYLIWRGLMKVGGYWQEALAIFQKQESLVLSFLDEQSIDLHQSSISRLFTSTYFFPYFRDDLKRNRLLHNQIAQIGQSHIQLTAQENVEWYQQRNLAISKRRSSSRPIKLGYLSHCLGRHSVGWLARWIFQYHDREKFQVNAYFINYKSFVKDSLQEWFVDHVDQAYGFEMHTREIAEQIYRDEIDVLIDLDSITLDLSCQILALKPAPVQLTWLGWDASGIPAIDYFIADPYVLPESAQEYYTEKIWRLPHTYIAVDGFEVEVPTLRREQLDIPCDAVVYLSAQTPFKRHRDTARLQMQIIKEVPQSYFLIKGLAEQESIQNFFIQIAEEEGVSSNRLRFLPDVDLEATHRANLAIADVVLDTYPYNGATTTLETLWMCIPIVTRVGEQFAARNSYTMMMNVGVTEGIAWTDEEYIEWGIRLGTDPELRQQISWKLRQSKHTSPLWNGKQFTREMEKAYEQMWANYVGENNS